MSIMGMRRKFARHLKVILWIIVVVFAAGVLFYGGSYYGAGRDDSAQEAQREAQKEIMATVDGENILRGELDFVYRDLLRQQAQYGVSMMGLPGVPLEALLGVRYYALKQIASGAMLAAEAKRRGLEYSKMEVEVLAQSQVDQLIAYLKEQAQQAGHNPNLYYLQIMADNGDMRTSVNEDVFRKWLLADILDNRRMIIERQILNDKLRASIIGTMPNISDTELMESFDEANLDYLVIPFLAEGEDSTNKALAKTTEIRGQLLKGTTFEKAALAAQEAGADYAIDQWLARPDLETIFGADVPETVFSLKIDELSEPIEIEAGYVIFRLNQTRRQLPADFAEKKEEHRSNLTAQRKTRKWNEFTQEMLQKMEIAPKLPETTGLLAFGEDRMEDAVEPFKETIKAPQVLPGEIYSATCYALGEYYLEQEQYDQAREYFVIGLSPAGDIPTDLVNGYPEDFYLAMGSTELAAGNKKEAMDFFVQAENSDTGNSNFLLHMKLLSIYEEIGDEDLIAQQNAWLDEYGKEQERLRQEAEARQAAQQQQQPPGDAPPVPMPLPGDDNAPLAPPEAGEPQAPGEN